jgi:hypothetical protein
MKTKEDLLPHKSDISGKLLWDRGEGEGEVSWLQLPNELQEFREEKDALYEMQETVHSMERSHPNDPVAA